MMAKSKAVRVPGYCALCWSSCGCVSVVEDGRLVAVEPNPTHPTGRALCAKGRAAPDLVHHDNRLLYPMKRTQPKTSPDPGWQRIGWDEALDTTAKAIHRITLESGGESLAFGITTPAGTGMQDGFQWVHRLCNAIGSPNVVASMEVCDFHSQNLNYHTFGSGMPMADLPNSSCVVVWGQNPTMTWIAHGSRIAEARARGAKLIVVDPRRAGLATKADQWLRLRPGTDGALALGLANLLIKDGHFDRDFVRRWTNAPFLIREDTGRLLIGADLGNADSSGSGDAQLNVAWDRRREQPIYYDRKERTHHGSIEDAALMGRFNVQGISCRPVLDLYAEICAAYPPERVQQITWVPASHLREAAALLGGSGTVSLSSWAGLEQHTNASQTARAIALLYTLTGSYDAPGGNVIFESVPSNNVSGGELLAAEQREKALDHDARPLGPEALGFVTAENLYEAALTGKPYPVRGLVNFGPNLLLSHADGQRGAEALANLDFMVNVDLFMTPTARYADIVLPATTPWERDGLKNGFEVSQEAACHVQYRQQVLEPIGESRSDAWIAFALADRLGLGDKFWDGDIEAGYRAILEPSGLDLEALRANPEGFRVPLETVYQKYKSGDQVSGGFATPSGKIEIFSESFLENGFPPLPEYVEPAMGPVSRPDLIDAFPLVLTTAKSPRYLQSQMRGVAALRRHEANPSLEIHPDAAKARGIEQGAWVTLATPSGKIRVKATYNANLDPRVVSATHGWWQACEALAQPGYDAESAMGANLNTLIGKDHHDPITGSVPLKSYLCQVTPFEA
jgi:anaerobic selenocysteine-containing dehydrogenase